MPLLARVMSFFRHFFRRRQQEEELDAEIRTHIEMWADQKIRDGMGAEEARRAAVIELGGVEQVKERVRAVRAGAGLDTLFQDVRFGLRILRRNPGFTVVAVLTLALGIGANTAIFSMVDTILLHPLPFGDASRLVALHEGVPKIGYPKMGFSPPDFDIFAREQKSFTALGAYQDERVSISGHGEPERVVAARVSAALFPMLGAKPMLGRTFAPEEDAPGKNVVILSYGLWQRRYGSFPGILGQTVELGDQPYAVIGVMPRRFAFPLLGPKNPDDNGSPADLWVPLAFTPAELKDWGGSYFTSVVGRLKPGVTLDRARGEVESLAPVIEAGYPAAIANVFRGALGLHISASPLQEEVTGSIRVLLLMLMAAVGLVLLIACANVAALLVSRAVTRQKEIAVRMALGATRLRLVRQMVTESLLLALGGGTLGFILALGIRNFILSVVPPSIPLPRHVPFDGGVFAFAVGLSILAAILFGLVPAFQISARSMQRFLQESGRSATPSRSHHRLQGVFVIIEFALALILLLGAGLLIRSFGKLLGTDPGFRPKNVLTLNVPLPAHAYPQAARIQDFYQQLLDRVSNVPGVQTVGISSDLPLNAREMVSVTVEGRGGLAAGKTPQAIAQSWVLGSYFQTMGIPLLQGRRFVPDDRVGSQPVAIVSWTMARKFWPGESAIGKRIRWGVKDPWQTVVGIVGDVNQGPLSAPVAPHVYRPYRQLPGPFLEEDPFHDWHAMNVAVHTRVDPSALTAAVLASVHSIDPDLAVTGIQTMTQVMGSSVAGAEFNMLLLGSLAALALFLSAIGVYGVLAHVVAQQTHEIGVRVALGAQPRDVCALILRRGARLSAIGIGLGLAAALALTHLMKGLLYGISSTDPLTWTAAILVLVLAALLASYIPARRATRVNPAVALR